VLGKSHPARRVVSDPVHNIISVLFYSLQQCTVLDLLYVLDA
jgi:hypothetical protein